MGQKVNPHGLRVGVIKDWDSRWYARNEKVGDLVVEDYNIRKYLKKTLYSAGIAKIEIERDNAKVTHLSPLRPPRRCHRQGRHGDREAAPGAGEDARQARGAEHRRGPAAPISNAQLVAENIAQQLEKRISFRRAMKQAMRPRHAAGRQGHQGHAAAAVWAAPRSPAARRYHEGTIPLQTLRADIDYGFAEANTTYGRIGVKVWIYKGEVLSSDPAHHPRTLEHQALQERRDRRRRDGRGRNNCDRKPG